MKAVLFFYLALVVAWPLIFATGKAIGFALAKVAERVTRKGACRALYDIGSHLLSSGALGLFVSLMASLAGGQGLGWAWPVVMIIAAALAFVGVLLMFMFGDCDSER